MADLKSKNYDPIALDLPNTNTPKFEEWFKTAEEAVNKMKGDLNIIGHSMGGLLALKLAEKHKVKKLVLVAPVGSKSSKDYLDSFTKDLSSEESTIFKNYQDRTLDTEKVKENSEKITFVFGEKDKWITKEIRDFYSDKFKDKAEFNLYPEYGHMADDEGVKRLPEVENLFKKPESPAKTLSPTTAKPESPTPTKKFSTDTKPPQEKKEPKKEKSKEPQIKKKEEAIAKGENFHASKKNCMYICSFIKNKSIDKAIEDLESVIKMKTPIPFKGEIPHRKGKGIMSGRYPIKASGLFINLLKGLKGNILVNQMDLDKSIISIASASWASRPQRRGGRQFKRTNVILVAKEVRLPQSALPQEQDELNPKKGGKK